MIVSISWRNVWRNKLRSSVIILASILGICAGIFSAAFYKGMMDSRIEKAIMNELSHIQIHNPSFRNSNEIHDYIPNANELVKEIAENPNVKGVSKRTVIYSMASSAETGAGVKIVGIDPEEEMQTTGLHNQLTEGDYFAEQKKNQVLIGDKLADKLNVKLNSKIVITLLDMDNNITYGAFRVVGIFRTANTTFNETNIFVRNNDIAKLINLPPDAAHEIAILANSNEEVTQLTDQVKSIAPKLEVMNWLELSPEMRYMSEALNMLMYIFIGIILLALLFGIVNTMLMVVLERVKEIGMLMAVGMSKVRIFLMIVLETVFLSLTGGVLGVLLGYLISSHFEKTPINLSMWMEGLSGMGFDPVVYTSIDFSTLIIVTVMVFFTGIIAALYPAYKALQNDPSEALRSE